MLISKELLSEVLDFEIYDLLVDKNIMYPLGFSSWRAGEMQLCNCKKYPSGLSEYELQHLMKVWAWEQGYELKSFKRIGNFKESGLYGCIVNTQDRRFFEAESHAKEEITVINTACQFILDQRKQDAN